MATKPDEAYVQILTATLQRTIDFLKFAETKNAALLAIASAWLVASINLECSGRTMPGLFTVCIPFAMFLSLIAGILAMLSFLPRLHLLSFLGGTRAGPHPKNLLYFGDISSQPIRVFEQEMRSRYRSETATHTEEYIHDLIVQVHVNSEITMRKMRLFLWGIRCIALAGMVLLPSVIQSLAGGMKGLW